MYGLGVGRETRHKCVYSSLKNSLVGAGSSPAQRGPSAVRGTKGCIPGGCQRKEGKKMSEVAPQHVTAGPATCREQGGLSLPLPALCFFLKYRNLVEFSP